MSHPLIVYGCWAWGLGCGLGVSHESWGMVAYLGFGPRDVSLGFLQILEKDVKEVKADITGATPAKATAPCMVQEAVRVVEGGFATYHRCGAQGDERVEVGSVPKMIH